jgi:hypothetical protein
MAIEIVVRGGAFRFRLPVWTVVKRKECELYGALNALPTIVDQTFYGTFLPLFTAETAAADFIREMPLTDGATLPIPDESHLRAVLNKHQSRGHQNVFIDRRAGALSPDALFTAIELLTAISDLPPGS